MTQVKEWSNQKLNRALAELMGNKIGRKVDYGFKPEYDRDVIALPNDRYKFIPDYCTDPAASLEVQTAAIAKDPAEYIRNMSIVQCGPDPKVQEMVGVNLKGAARIADAKPRERAEAAYKTLSQVSGQ